MSARNIEVLLHAVRDMNFFSDEDAQTTALVLQLKEQLQKKSCILQLKTDYNNG